MKGKRILVDALRYDYGYLSAGPSIVIMVRSSGPLAMISMYLSRGYDFIIGEFEGELLLVPVGKSEVFV